MFSSRPLSSHRPADFVHAALQVLDVGLDLAQAFLLLGLLVSGLDDGGVAAFFQNTDSLIE